MPLIISAGQKVAKILTQSINVKVANMKQILRNYSRRSAIKMNLVPGKVNKIEYNDAVDIQSAIYQGLPSFEGDEIPSDIKRKAVELSVINRRAAEEIDLCRQDMICTINHLIKEKKIVLAAEYNGSNPVSSRYSRGAVSLLNQKIIQLDGMISCYGKMFIDAEGITREEIDSFSLQRVVLLNIPFPMTSCCFCRRTVTSQEKAPDHLGILIPVTSEFLNYFRITRVVLKEKLIIHLSSVGLCCMTYRFWESFHLHFMDLIKLAII